jgi:hypothetical protein
MNRQTDEQLGTVLRAMGAIAPEPPPLPAAVARRPAPPRPLLVAAGAFVAVLLVGGIGTVVVRAASGGGGAAPVTIADDSDPAPGLPRYTIDLPGWGVADVVDATYAGTAVFAEQADGGEWDGRSGAIVSAWSESPDNSAVTTMPPGGEGQPPLHGYEAAIAALADAEHLGTVDVTGGVTAEAFRLGGADPEYEFVWRYNDAITVQVVVRGGDYEAAKRVVAAVVPITEDAWDELVARFPPTDLATTTMPPGTPAPLEPGAEDPTTTTMP